MSSSPEPAAPDRPTGRARRLLVVAGIVVSAQALVLLGLAGTELVSLDARRLGLGVSTAVFLGGFGLLLLVAVVQILRGQSWTRGFLVFSQLLALVLSFNFRQDAWWIPVGLGGSALVALAVLVSPPVSEALADRPPEDPSEDPRGDPDHSD